MSEFFAMGGYASYVWGSFAAAAAVLVWNVLAPKARRRELLKVLAEDQGANQQDIR